MECLLKKCTQFVECNVYTDTRTGQGTGDWAGDWGMEDEIVTGVGQV